jgi:nitrogen-specific signal transduction histidine kinase/CheY-like chemotaxis protein
MTDDQGRTVRMIGAMQDETERRALQAQLVQSQKMEAVGRLAGGVAHDFNNLMTAIMGFADLIARRMAADDPRRRYLDEITAAAERAAAVTRQLLAFGRRQMLKPQVLDLAEVVARAQGLLGRLVHGDIALEVSTAGPTGRVRADPTQMEQVLMNLVLNARDAMPDGGRLTITLDEVTVRSGDGAQRAGAAPGPCVRLTVGDNGHGMDAETLARAFEPFFTTKEVGRGTGLGLSTVYGIVRQSGGAVLARSEPGRGSTFEVLLPRVDVPLAPAPEPPLPAPVVRPTETVLLVDDEDAIRRALGEILRATGYTVLEARDGADALDVAAQAAGPIHLLLSDAVLPQMKGRELAQRLSVSRPGLKVLFMSGYAEAAAREEAVLGRGEPFLVKPFPADILARKVREVLEA